jgi:alkylhydroperoxidase/carboxymuconolactone decarboxylase family protein YurZ
MLSRRLFLAGATTAGALSLSGTASAQVDANRVLQMMAANGQLPEFISPTLFGDAPFETTLAAGTTSLVTGLAEIYLALDDRLSAEQLMALPAALAGGYGRSEINSVNEGLASKSNIDLDSVAGVAGEEAQQHIRNATLQSGLSTVYHAIAVEQARELAASTSNSARGLGGGLGGLRSAANVVGNRRTISLATAVTTTLPQNARMAMNIFSVSRQYMQANNLSLPSEEEAAALIADF